MNEWTCGGGGDSGDGTYNNNNDNNSQVGLNQDKLTSSSLIVIHIHPKPSVHFTPFPPTLL